MRHQKEALARWPIRYITHIKIYNSGYSTEIVNEQCNTGDPLETSCETQLILTVHDLLESFEHKHRVDIGVLDFSIAFDTVPHPHLLKKLQHLGIHGDLYHWLTSFLTERDQRVVMEGSYSSFLHVDSGIPQGTVLGPLLFLSMIFLSALIVTLDYLLMIV